MNKMKYCNINFEGCDCSGKSTLHNYFQRKTKYNYSAHDRAYMSMYIHEIFFKRQNVDFWLNKLIEDLSREESLYVVLLPDFEIIKERYIKRGDEFVELDDVKKLYDLFKTTTNNLKEFKSLIILNDVNIDKNIQLICERLDSLNANIS